MKPRMRQDMKSGSGIRSGACAPSGAALPSPEARPLSTLRTAPTEIAGVGILQSLVSIRSLSISRMVMKIEMKTRHLRNNDQNKSKVSNLILKTRKRRTINLKTSLKRKRRKIVEKNPS